MAGFSLGIHRLLLPWKSAGVEYLLCDEATLAALRVFCFPKNAAGPYVPNSSTVTPVQPTLRSVSVCPQPSAPSGSAGSAAAALEAREKSRTPYPSAGVFPSATVLASWRVLREKKTPPHPRLVWTYAELAEDMNGRGGTERRRLWQRLIADLALPKGSIAFWPLASPTEQPSSSARCDPEFFFFGINELRPQTVFFFCSKLPDELALPTLTLFQPMIVNGVKYVLLHEPSQIAEDLRTSSSRYQRFVGFLKWQSG